VNILKSDIAPKTFLVGQTVILRKSNKPETFTGSYRQIALPKILEKVLEKIAQRIPASLGFPISLLLFLIYTGLLYIKY